MGGVASGVVARTFARVGMAFGGGTRHSQGMTAPIPPGSRARTPEQFRAVIRKSRVESPATMPEGFEFRPGDVAIATYPKCGTTWTQQIIHGLRTGGSMDFDEISLVVPWIEQAASLGIDLNADQVAKPRAFKTHLPWYLLPKGAQNIFITREPGDVLVSFYHFFKDMVFEGDDIDIDVFADELFFAEAAHGSYWQHVVSWWQVRERDDVLFLCYEDMKTDLRPIVARMARFCGIEADDELIDLATRQASIDFMKAHGRQFDDHPTTLAFTKQLGMPPAKTTKVRTGRVGDRSRELSPRVVAALDEAWQREVGEALGLSSYAELRAALAAEQP